MRPEIKYSVTKGDFTCEVKQSKVGNHMIWRLVDMASSRVMHGGISDSVGSAIDTAVREVDASDTLRRIVAGELPIPPVPPVGLLVDWFRT